MPSLCAPVTDIFRRNQESVLPLVDAVSFKKVTDESFADKEQMLDCSLNITHPSFQRHLEESGLLGALQSGRFSSFACDLGPACMSFNTAKSPNGYPRYIPVSKPVSEEVYTEQARQNVHFLRTCFGGRIKVENLNYFPTGAYELVCDPDFISRVLQHLSVELLLDVAHMKISSHNMNVSVIDYLHQLPLDLVSEVHLSGANNLNGVWEDTHELPSEVELDILNHVLLNSEVRHVTLEYYKHDLEFLSAYQHLHDMLESSSNDHTTNPLRHPTH